MKISSERGEAGIYLLLVPLLLSALLVVLAFATVSTVETARAEVASKLELALRQVSDEWGAVDATASGQGVTDGSAAWQLTDQALASEMPQGWSWQLDSVSVYTNADAGKAAPPGVVGGVVPGAGIYAEVSLTLTAPFVGPVTIQVPEFLQSNAFDTVQGNWQGG